MYNIQRSRPLGVTILAILLFISSVLTLLLGIYAISTGLLGPFNALLVIVLPLIQLAVAWGLWTLKPWAFWATVVLQAINLVYVVINFATNGDFLGFVLNLAFPIIILAYLFLDRDVRAAFHT